MRVYFKLLRNGELPAMDVGNNLALTIEYGKVINARHYNATKAYAVEKTYIERHNIWNKIFIDISDDIGQWCNKPKIATLREAIRIPLMRDARSMMTRNVMIFIRSYYISEHQYGSHLINFIAGMIGFNAVFPFICSFVHGPSWEFETERFIDSIIISGNSIPEGMTRYGITPRGRIINPLPPICEECGNRHSGNDHRESFGEWAKFRMT